MTESSDTADTPAKPQDYAGLRAELATLVDDFSPLINELWPRLEDHKYRWELHTYGLPDGYDKASCRRHLWHIRSSAQDRGYEEAVKVPLFRT